MKNASASPRNPESELRQAYNCVIECCMVARNALDVNLTELLDTYKQAFHAHLDGNRLATERWAKTAQHLARAYWHEEKVRYLEQHSADLPYLTGGNAKDYALTDHSDTTQDLLDSLVGHLPEETSEAHHVMQRYLARAQEHLNTLDNAGESHELLRAERIKAAAEYGRTVELMSLACGTQKTKKTA